MRADASGGLWPRQRRAGLKTIFVGANVFPCFLPLDDRGQHDQAFRLFQQAAAGKVALATGPPVLFEIAWTLRSAYRQSNASVLEVLSAIAAAPGLVLTDRRSVEAVPALGKTSEQECADAYIAAASRECAADEVATFNRKYCDRLGVTLYEF